MADPRLHVVENDVWQVGLLPGTGGSIAFGRIRVGQGWVDLLRPTPPDRYSRVEDCASYVLAPWSNRIRDGVFRFRRTEYRVRPNFIDGTAIHGTARNYPWRVIQAESGRLALGFDSRETESPAFPFPFSSTVEFRVEGHGFTTTTTVRNEADQPFCAGFGHHPYFQRSLAGGADDEVQAEIPFNRWYVTERCIPTSAAVPVEPRVDFRRARPFGKVFVDDCLTGRTAAAPVRLTYPRSGVTVELTMDELYSHLVVYAPVGETFFAVEPVTHVNDGFNLYERAVPGTGVFVLEPRTEARAAFSLRVSPGSASSREATTS